MKIVYSLPHPVDRLETEQAGHIVRANAILNALESLGHEVIRVQAASGGAASQGAAKGYRSLVKKLLPKAIAMPLRDRARVAFGKHYAERLTEIVKQEQPDVLLETHIAFSLGGTLASENTGVPIIFDDVAPSWEEAQQYGVGANDLAVKTHQQVMAQASRVVAVSAAIHQLLIEDGVPSEKVITVSNGINESLFHQGVDGSAIRRQYNIPEDAVTIVFVGSFQPYHRVDLLFDAAKKLTTDKPVYLLLVGGDKDQTEQYDASDTTIFAGRIPYENVAQYIAAGDITVMPATNDYGNPMKIYEYMALGKAIIAPNQPTIREIAEHGDGIYMFEQENIDDLARALQTLIDDDALRTQLGERALALSPQFTWRARAEIISNAMHEIVG